MEFVQNFPFFSIMLAMLCAVLCSVLKRRAALWLTIGLTAVSCAMQTVFLVWMLTVGGDFVYQMGHFTAPWCNELRAGVLEAFMSCFFGFVMLLSILGGLRHIDIDLEHFKTNLYCVMLNLLLGALYALVYTNDLFTAYVFIEISTLASTGLLMVRQVGRTTLAAVRYMIVSLLGSGLLLMGIVLLYNQTGHLLMEYIQTSVGEIFLSGENTEPLLVVVSLIITGLAIKAGLFPFHYWMPDTYGYSTPTSSAILSGLVSKGYIFLTLKIIYRVIGFDIICNSHILNALYIFGFLAIIVGSVSAIRENDIRRMTAFSSAAQIGYIYMSFGLGTTAGVVAALFHIICHTITKPLLFISASALSDVSGGSKKFHELRGAGFRDVSAGIGFSVGALSMVGFPMLSGFISKLLIGTACLQNSGKMLPTLIVLAVSTVLNAIYFLRTAINLYRPAVSDQFPTVKMSQHKLFTAVMVCFIILNFIAGLHSQPIIDVLEKGLQSFS